jgi:hypothetical protein
LDTKLYFATHKLGVPPYEYHDLLTKIHGAIALLDPNGTNQIITQAMSIVYEGFKRHEANLQFSANDLLIFSEDELAE